MARLPRARRRLATFDYDLVAWRADQEGKPGKGAKEWAEGFAMMDLEGGSAWDLVTQVPPPPRAAMNVIAFDL